MNRFSVKCPECTYPLAEDQYNSASGHQDCPSCKSKISVFAMPALYRGVTSMSESTEAQLEDAVCFYHEGKKAEQLCDDCGRFLCSLCTLPIGNDTLCASCLEIRRKQKSGDHTFTSRVVRYDKLAFGLAILPLLYFPFTFVTAPASIFVAIRYWKKNIGIASGIRTRMVLALIFAVLEIAGWVIGISILVRELSSGG